MGAVTPRNAELEAKILELLTGGFPLKTHEVVAGIGHPRHMVHEIRPRLNRLERTGQIGRAKDGAWIYWFDLRST